MKFDGTTVKLGEMDYVIPPLNLKSLKKLQPKLSEFTLTGGGLPTLAQIDVMLEVIHEAVRRNYPDITLSALEDIVDLGNLSAAFLAVVTASGLAPRGEAVSPTATH